MNTSSITFLWQHENFVSLYCNDYFNGHNKLHIDDNEVIKDYNLESTTVIINDLLTGIYRIWTSGPDGQSEDKYIEIYPEGIKEQLYYICIEVLVCLFLVLFTKFIWKKGIKKYSGVNS